MAYATTQDVLNLIQTIRPDFVLTNINEAWLDFAEAKVDSILEDSMVDTPATDRRNLLKYATVCYYLEFAANRGQIQSTFGDLKRRKMDKVETEFDSKTPMFFFATGGAKGFYSLLAHETWRMNAYQFVLSYIKSAYRISSGKKVHYAVYSADNTQRGTGWRDDHSDSDSSTYGFYWDGAY